MGEDGVLMGGEEAAAPRGRDAAHGVDPDPDEAAGGRDALEDVAVEPGEASSATFSQAGRGLRAVRFSLVFTTPRGAAFQARLWPRPPVG